MQKERIQRKINEHRKEGEYIIKLLQACKSWGGPCTTAIELEIRIKMSVIKLSELNFRTIEKLIKLKFCIVVWEVEKEVKWFIGYVKEILEDGYIVEHLHRSPSTQNDFWNYPSPGDIQTLSKEQIIPCQIDGDWEPTNNTSTRIDFKFHLRNSSAIENTFKRLMNL